MIFQCCCQICYTSRENRKLLQSVKVEKDTEALNLKIYLFLNELSLFTVYNTKGTCFNKPQIVISFAMPYSFVSQRHNYTVETLILRH
jgi:hypothetical protein